jgi:hypothetical protein
MIIGLNCCVEPTMNVDISQLAGPIRRQLKDLGERLESLRGYL